MLPLEGVTVVSLEHAVAAPFTTRQLADLGARVIKVERPGVGDFARGYDETVRGLASHFVWLNRSKESLALDLKQEASREAISRLVARADVFVQNLAPGAAARLGLGAEELRARHTRLVHCSISGYGEGGPYTQKKAYDLLVQCEAGLVSITGTEDTPSKVGISTAEVSMLEALAEWMGFPLNYTMYGGAELPRTGASHAAIAPYGPFACGDGGIVFLGIQNEREWATFCLEVLRLSALATDERFSTNSRRVEHLPALRREIEGAFGGVGSEEVLSRLETAGIANARLPDVAGLAEHPRLAARDRWREFESPVGTLRTLLPPARLDADEPLLTPIPEVGQHTASILRELGLDAEPRLA